MSGWMRKILESKRAARQELAALPFARKLDLPEKLRDRNRLIAASPLALREKSAKKYGKLSSLTLGHCRASTTARKGRRYGGQTALRSLICAGCAFLWQLT
jgi:hypothetical protein